MQPGCGLRPKSQGWCAKHYQASRAAGAVAPRWSRAEQAALCLVVDCDARPVNRGMCSKHTQQRRAGILDVTGKVLRAPKTTGRTPKEGAIVDRAGYLRVRPPEGYSGKTSYGRVLEHRLVVEQRLGRLLRADEIVHHRNGRREDNRPENLEVMTRRQHPPAHETPIEYIWQALEHLRINDVGGYAVICSRLLTT